MAQLVFSIFVSLVFVVLALVWALASHRPARRPRLTLDELILVHHREYALVSAHLTECDQLLRRIRLEQRETALGYLDVLRGDFLRLDRLLNHAVKFLPDLKPQEEFGRFARALRFRLEFRLLRLSIQVGLMPSTRLQALTREIAELGAWAERVLGQAAIRSGLPSLQADLNRF